MASKNLHVVTITGTHEVENDPSGALAHGEFDIALELSRQYGRHIRQGNNFRLVGYGLAIQVPGQDTGAGAIANIAFTQPNAHKVRAWNNMFKAWKAQKKIQAKVGRQMRFDDFEVALIETGVDSRTSHILDDPFTAADGDSQDLVLAGNSDDGNNITSIFDVYNSRFPAPLPSESHYGSAIKASKIGEHYIDQTDCFTNLVAQASASGGVDVGSTPDSLGWGVSIQDMVLLPTDNHLNIMCGRGTWSIRFFPEDTGAQIADELSWQITLLIEGWSSLADTKKSKSKGGKK